MALRPYQIHASLQILALVSFLFGIYYARRHKRPRHHGFVYSGAALSTLAVFLMVFQMGGLPSLHGKLGFSVYLIILAVALIGRLFFGRRLKRSQHRTSAFLGVLLFSLMILTGLFTFVF
jgi:protein-S-isoprenylcysteine O-methyltransferase Ste14